LQPEILRRRFYREWYNLCSKAAKMFRKSTIFKHNSFTQHALCCRAPDLEFWEAVGRVPFDQQKFRKFEPVIFVEWKAPDVFAKWFVSNISRDWFEKLVSLKTLL